MQIPFESHGGCSVALIGLKGQKKRTYHYSKTIGQEESWALRDYMTEQILRSADSGMKATDLEKLVSYALPPEYRAVGHISAWKKDCVDASNNNIGAANVDFTTLNDSTLGTWRRMNKRGS